NYLQSQDRLLAYLLSFHLANAERLCFVLERLEKRLPFLSSLKEADIWDIGCGTGAMASSLLQMLLQGNIKSKSFTFIDHNEEVLSLIPQVFSEIPETTVTTYRKPLEQFLPNISENHENPQLFLFGYVFNELPAKTQEQW